MAFTINAQASAPRTAMLRSSSNAVTYSVRDLGRLGDLDAGRQQLDRDEGVVVPVEKLLRP